MTLITSVDTKMWAPDDLLCDRLGNATLIQVIAERSLILPSSFLWDVEQIAMEWSTRRGGENDHWD